jgi:DNA-binding response OmpR family regulator
VPGQGARILLVEDEPAWVEVLAGALSAGGHRVRAVGSAAAARAAVASDPPDLVVLNLILPDQDGLVLCADLKREAAAPILICSPSQRRGDMVLALRLGADDFVARPCDLDELIERVGVLLRPARSARRWIAVTAPAAGPLRAVEAGDGRGLVLDPIQRRAHLGAAIARLTPTEYRLLAALAASAGRAVPRPALAWAVFGRHGGERALETLVWRLRGKLAALGAGAPLVEAARGIGYALVTAPAPPEGELVSAPPVASGPRARAVIDFANGLTGELPAEQQPAAFGAFLTAYRLGIAQALGDAAWAQAADEELAAGLAEDPEEQRRRAVWALAEIRHRAAVYGRRAAAARRRAEVTDRRAGAVQPSLSHPASPTQQE